MMCHSVIVAQDCRRLAAYTIAGLVPEPPPEPAPPAVVRMRLSPTVMACCAVPMTPAADTGNTVRTAPPWVDVWFVLTYKKAPVESKDTASML